MAHLTRRDSPGSRAAGLIDALSSSPTGHPALPSEFDSGSGGAEHDWAPISTAEAPSPSGDLDAHLRQISEVASGLLGVERVGIWLYNAERTQIECVDLFARRRAVHSSGDTLEARQCPSYFEALERERVLAAGNAITDPRTCELREGYLQPNGIGAVLDVPIRVDGEVVGVARHEAVGPSRIWEQSDHKSAASVSNFASLAIQLFKHAQSANQGKRTAVQLTQPQSMEVLGRFSGGVAHGFNNLLVVVRASLDLLHDRLGNVSDDIRAELANIEDATDRAEKLTRQILMCSRGGGSSPIVVSPDVAIEELRGILGRLVRDDIEVRIRTDRATPPIKIDPGHLEQIVLNLVTNAADAMRDGGTLSIATGRDACGQFVLRVSDTGTGIGSGTLEHVFEPFFTTKEVGEGTGLGLATVQGIVESAGGEIAIETVLREGTTVTVVVPAAKGGLAPVPEPPPGASARPGEATILVCEDNTPVREAIEQTLSARGYRVLSAPHPEVALALARSCDRPIDLLITDLVMPKGSGLDLVDALRNERTPLRSIVISGYVPNASDDERFARHGTVFLPKPFRLAAFLAVVEASLAQSPP